jgi:hypothetical protein
MSAPSVTYTFTNATTADATQVNTNFTDLINGASDGTKDYSINQLTVAGAATFNGNVTFGNASGDNITMTGSIASSLTVSANDTYDFGSSTLAMRSFYIGSGTRSIRLIAGAVTGSYTLTLPVAVPTLTGMGLIFDTSATATFRFPEKFTGSKTSAYTATGDETIIPCAPAASFTLDLPTAASAIGKRYTVIKTDSDETKIVTVDPNGAETVDGAASVTVGTQYEARTLASNGTSWFTLAHYKRHLYQIKTLSADAGAAVTGIAALGFANLEVGKVYRMTMHAKMSVDASNQGTLDALHNGTIIAEIRFDGDTGIGGNLFGAGASAIFVAVATTVTFNWTRGGGVTALNGNGTTAETWSMLEELPNAIVTAKW